MSKLNIVEFINIFEDFLEDLEYQQIEEDLEAVDEKLERLKKMIDLMHLGDLVDLKQEIEIINDDDSEYYKKYLGDSKTHTIKLNNLFIK